MLHDPYAGKSKTFIPYFWANISLLNFTWISSHINDPTCLSTTSHRLISSIKPVGSGAHSVGQFPFSQNTLIR